MNLDPYTRTHLWITLGWAALIVTVVLTLVKQ